MPVHISNDTIEFIHILLYIFPVDTIDKYDKDKIVKCTAMVDNYVLIGTIQNLMPILEKLGFGTV